MGVMVSIASVSCTADTPEAKAGWSAAAQQMPTPRTEVAAAYVDGLIHVIGGFTADGEASRAHEAFDPKTLTWQTIGELRTPLHHASAVTDGESLFLVGGFRSNGFASKRIIRWTGQSNWENVASLDEGRAAAAVAFVQGRIHVASGTTTVSSDATEVDEPSDSSSTATHTPLLTGRHDAWDPKTQAWTRLADLPEPRDHLAGAEGLSGGFVAIGGRKLSLDTNSTRIDLFRNGEWKNNDDLDIAVDLAVASGGLGAAFDGHAVFVVGGEAPGGTIASVQGFFPVGGGFRGVLLPDLPTPRHGLGVVVAEGRLWAIAGGETPGLSVSGLVESYLLDTEQ